jgi:biopolymer transport protein ExbB
MEMKMPTVEFDELTSVESFLIPPDNVIEAVQPYWLEMVLAGGPVVWLLAGMSIFSLTLVFLKGWQFWFSQPEAKHNIALSLTLWKHGKTEQAQSKLDLGKPVQRLIFDSMQAAIEGKTQSQIEKGLSRRANDIMFKLRSLLRPLEVIANISPLLGLMGTVVGMIVAFQQMEAAGANVDPSVLSGGVWQALLTTAAGLVVAIPVSVMHSYFERRAERVHHLINDSVTQVLTDGLPTQKHEDISLIGGKEAKEYAA